MSRSSLGLLPLVGRRKKARYKRGKRERNLKKSAFCANTPNFIQIGGRAYPVRHYPIAIRLRTLAFGNMVAMIVDPVNIRATCASALPTHSRSSWGPHNILRHSMYCAQSSKWGLFGRNTRSAIRGTSSLKKSAFSGKSTRISFGSNRQRKASARQMLRTKDAVWYWQLIVA